MTDVVRMFADAYKQWRTMPARFSVDYHKPKWRAPEITVELSKPVGNNLRLSISPGDECNPLIWYFHQGVYGLPLAFEFEEARMIGKITFCNDGVCRVFLADDQFSRGTGWREVDSITDNDRREYIVPGEVRP